MDCSNAGECGWETVTMPQASKTFRIFVSSTFTDLEAERNALHRAVFPKLKDECAKHGCRFQAIDLRWGVSQEAGLDQQAVRVCIEEIKRCQRTTPRPNFVVLLGDRYGWRPAPAEIPAGEFESLAAQVGREECALLDRWYRRDDNAVPSVYCLQPRRLQVPAEATTEQIEAARSKERESWEQTEPRLRGVLLEAATRLGLPGQALHKYLASATEQEIDQGVLSAPDAAEHVFCFFRRFGNLAEVDAAATGGDEQAAGFVDLNAKGDIDDEARSRLVELRGRLRDELPGNVREYETLWRLAAPSGEHLERLCDEVHDALLEVILAEIERMESQDVLDKEVAGHAAFAEERGRFFVGRAAALERISGYVKGDSRQPLCVFGAGGSGKSALVARASAAEHAGNRGLPGTRSVTRFIGATPSSSDGRALLESLCHEISAKYGDESETPAAYEELVDEFPRRLGLASPEKPLAVFIDSLDRLSDAHNAGSLVWLPRELPDSAKIVVTTRPGERLSALRHKLPQEHVVELEPMPAEEGSELLDLWLADENRTLQPPQKEEVLAEFGAAGLPLYLRLAFVEARRWKSYTTDIDLRPDVAGIIRDLYERLSSEENHGRLLVSRSLGLLAASRDMNGLSEDELLDVLSSDAEVFEDFKRRALHEPPEQILPVVVWSRLYLDLEPYLAELTTEGATLLTFYHPELGEVAREMFLAEGEAIARSRQLARYFRSRIDPTGDGSWDGPSLRGLSELPYHLTKGKMWDELFETMTAFKFLERKAAEVGVEELTDLKGRKSTSYTGAFALLADYDLALGYFPSE
ncbi:MAG: DUF4062 domain-containing protein [Actinobacteria bacterium]|nr:MAG: DUF4062 domain-containing protein [Actinomycetota bacterium]